jgi:CRISPR system Cascade subunit CasA
VVGDPWAPIKLEGNKSFTATAQGLGYRQMVELLDRSRFTRPLLAEATKAEARGHGPMAIYAAALARGQGKTEGFHWRSVILSPSSSARFAADEPSFSERSARFVALAGDASGKALRPALVQLLQGKEKPDWKKPSNDALVEPWLRQFDEQIDREFFAELSRSFDAELSDEAAERAFSALLERAAQNVFEQAVNASPRTDQVRVLGVARAQLLLTSSLRKHLPLTRPAEENIDV